jgi:hypothetical protein
MYLNNQIAEKCMTWKISHKIFKNKLKTFIFTDNINFNKQNLEEDNIKRKGLILYSEQ